MAGGLRLALGRVVGSSGQRALVAASAGTVALAAAALVALTGFATAVPADALERGLRTITPAQAATTVTTTVPAGEVAAAEGVVRRAVARSYAGLPAELSFTATSGSYTLPGQHDASRPDLTVFAAYDGLARHATFTSGREPRPVTGQEGRPGEIEAAVAEPAARAMEVAPGDRLKLRDRVDGEPLTVTITGVFRVRDTTDPRWGGDPLLATGERRLDYTTYGPLAVPSRTFLATFGPQIAAHWTVLPHLTPTPPPGQGPGQTSSADATPPRQQAEGPGGTASAERLRALSAGVSGLGARLDREAAVAVAGGGGIAETPEFAVAGRLPAQLSRLTTAGTAGEAALRVVVIALAVPAGAALLLAARLVAARRQRSDALIRARGASRRQLLRQNVIEGLLITLPAALLAPPLAAGVLRLVAVLPPVRDAALTPPAVLVPAGWAIAAAVALACTAVLAVPAYRSGSSRVRAALELLVIVLAVLALWQLARYGGPLAPRQGGGVAADPLAAAALGFALLAGGLIAARLPGPVASAIARVTARGSGVALPLAAGYVAHGGAAAAGITGGASASAGATQRGSSEAPRRRGAAGPVLLVAAAVALAIVSVAAIGAWERSVTDRAALTVGADLRVTAPPPVPTAPSPLGQGGRYAALPGVGRADPVLRTEVQAGGEPATLLAIADPALRGPAPLAALPLPPTAREITIRIRADGGGTALARLVLGDTRGVTQKIRLGELPADGHPHELTIPLTPLAGPGGLLTPPSSTPGGTPSPGAGSGSSAGPGGTPAPGGGSGPAGTPGTSSGPSAGPGGATAPGGSGPSAGAGGVASSGLVVRGVRASRTTGGGGGPEVSVEEIAADGRAVALPAGTKWSAPVDAGGEAVRLLVPTSAKEPRIGPGGTPERAAIPAVVTEDLARRMGLSPGESFTVALDMPQPLTVKEIRPVLPGVSGAGIRVDFAGLGAQALRAGGAPYVPGEWWLTAPGGSAAAQRQLTAHPAWSAGHLGRDDVVRDLRSDPIGGGLPGALLLAAVAGAVFAAAGAAAGAAATVRDRREEYAVLRALGASRGQIARGLLTEQLLGLGIGLLAGVALGVPLARGLLPLLILDGSGAPVVPPVEVATALPVLTAVLGGAVLFSLVVGVTIAAALRRGELPGRPAS